MVPIRIEPETVKELTLAVQLLHGNPLSGLLSVWIALLLQLCDRRSSSLVNRIQRGIRRGWRGWLDASQPSVRLMQPSPLMSSQQSETLNLQSRTQSTMATCPFGTSCTRLPRTSSSSTRTGVTLYQTMLQLIDDHKLLRCWSRSESQWRVTYLAFSFNHPFPNS